MALPGGSEEAHRSIEFVQTPTELISPSIPIQYILLARFVRFALCKGLRPLHPRTALARCPPSLAPLPGYTMVVTKVTPCWKLLTLSVSPAPRRTGDKCTRVPCCQRLGTQRT